MRSLNILFFTLIIFSAKLFAQDNNVLYENANQNYASGKYAEAITAYEKIMSGGYEAPELYFNLGNCYLKTNNTGKAILYYEKAKKLLPNDEEINYNLKMANQKVVDKIEAVPQLFISEWKNSFYGTFSEKGWSLLCILVFILSAILFAVYAILNSIAAKQLAFFSGVVLLLAGIFIFFIAKSTYSLSATQSEAIVMLPSVTIKGSPDENGTKLFILHEGSKVKLEDSNNDWLEVKLPNGNTGWVKTRAVEKI